MIRLLLAKLDKVDEAMRNTRDCIRTHFMSLTTDDHGHDHSASGLDPSPDIHVATQFAVSYIIVLSTSNNNTNNSPPSVDPPTAYDEGSLCLGEENNTSSSTNLNTVIIRSLGESLTRVRCRSHSWIGASGSYSWPTISTSCGTNCFLKICSRMSQRMPWLARSTVT